MGFSTREALVERSAGMRDGRMMWTGGLEEPEPVVAIVTANAALRCDFSSAGRSRSHNERNHVGVHEVCGGVFAARNEKAEMQPVLDSDGEALAVLDDGVEADSVRRDGRGRVREDIAYA
jgi:hypothetical protein